MVAERCESSEAMIKRADSLSRSPGYMAAGHSPRWRSDVWIRDRQGAEPVRLLPGPSRLRRVLVGRMYPDVSTRIGPRSVPLRGLLRSAEHARVIPFSFWIWTFPLLWTSLLLSCALTSPRHRKCQHYLIRSQMRPCPDEQPQDQWHPRHQHRCHRHRRPRHHQLRHLAQERLRSNRHLTSQLQSS